MSYVTLSSARGAAAARGFSRAGAELEMRKAATAPITTNYDIFLSHSSEDADVVAGVNFLLEREGVTVYVYWAEGDQTNRVTAATAARLRARMQRCGALIYLSSQASPSSKW